MATSKKLDNKSDLIGYVLWRGDLSFEQDPFNEVDGVIFSQLVYINYKQVVEQDFSEGITLSHAYEKYSQLPDFAERNHIGAMINDKIPELFRVCSLAPRYRDIVLKAYEDIMDTEKELQFAALTFCVNKNFSVIAFRGTDDSLLGWKEDMNLLYCQRIPTHDCGKIYLDRVEKSVKGDIILAGHSKGGNGVVVAASEASSQLKNRIKAIYNIDGTGCRLEFFESDGFKQIKDKIFSLYPSFCVVGMIFEHPENFNIVESEEFAAMQHDPLSWHLVGKEFVRLDDFTKESKYFHSAVNKWIEKVDSEQAERFINTTFDVINASGAKTNMEIEKNSLHCGAKMIAKFSSLDNETKKSVQEFIQLFLQVFKNCLPMLSVFNVKENIKDEIRKISEKAKERSESFEAEIRELLKKN